MAAHAKVLRWDCVWHRQITAHGNMEPKEWGEEGRDEEKKKVKRRGSRAGSAGTCDNLAFTLRQAREGLEQTWYDFDFIYLFLNSYLFGCARSFVAACGIFIAVCGTLSCSMRDLVPWPGIEPRSHVLGAQSLNHWTIREVPIWFWPTPGWEQSQYISVSYKCPQKTSINLENHEIPRGVPRELPAAARIERQDP